MYFPLTSANLDAIVAGYQRDGVVVLTDVDPRPLDILTRMLAGQSGLSPEAIRSAGQAGGVEITDDVRARLARGHMTPELRDASRAVFGELLLRLVGPIVHTSQTFHYQLKARTQRDVILHGYHGDGREVQSLYGIHNEFTAARVLTTPSAVVCWVPLNTFDGKALYFYPGSHRHGLLANRWLPRHDACEGIERVGPVVEYQPRLGEAVIFNFLVLHGSGAAVPGEPAPGPQPTRISCDLRFFPFAGILDSEASLLRPHPVEWIREQERALDDDLLRAPLWETLAYLGEPIHWPSLPSHSVAHWGRFVEGLVRGDAAQRDDAIRRLANTTIGFDPIEPYLERFAPAALTRAPYASIAPQVPQAAHMLRAIPA
ncbi:MAG: phytanoyl-CoA dioxygenase family protein [Vicinamibacterales bacterium]